MQSVMYVRDKHHDVTVNVLNVTIAVNVKMFFLEMLFNDEITG